MDMPLAPIEVFYSYADVDASFVDQLEKHLSLLRYDGLITTWHKRRILAGTKWNEELDDHLNTASLILLLISPDFVASDYHYGVEMQRAMQRHEANEARVILLLLRSIDLQGAQFEKLKTLPRNQKPITTWRNRDVAFTNVVKDIRETLKEIQHLNPSSTPIHSNDISILSTSPISDNTRTSVLNTPPKTNEDIREGKKTYQISIRHFTFQASRKSFFITFLSLLLLLVFPFIKVAEGLGEPHHLQNHQLPINRQIHTNPQEIHDKNLDLKFVALQSTQYEIPNNPMQYSLQNPPSSVGALRMDEASSSYRLILGIRSIQQGVFGLVIQKVALTVDQLPTIPDPLNVWSGDEPQRSYQNNPYRVVYIGEDTNTTIPATYLPNGHPQPSEFVQLTPGESDNLGIQVFSFKPVDLKFHIQITYRVFNDEQDQNLVLPYQFEAIFSKVPNWHLFQFQKGHFIRA